MLTYQFLFFLSFLCIMSAFLSPLLREDFTSRYHFNNCFYLRFVTTDYWRTKPSKLRICLQGFYLGPCNTFHQLHIHFSTKENRPLNIALTTRDKTLSFLEYCCLPTWFGILSSTNNSDIVCSSWRTVYQRGLPLQLPGPELKGKRKLNRKNSN